MPDMPALQDAFGQSTEQQPECVFPVAHLLGLFHAGTGMPLEALLVNPARPHWMEPRVKKRRPKSFPFMIKPRQDLRQQLLQQVSRR